MNRINENEPLMCGRCTDFVDKLYPPKCLEKPESPERTGLGMYHCPECGTMLVAGIPHPWVCKDCLDQKKVGWDLPPEKPKKKQKEEKVLDNDHK